MWAKTVDRDPMKEVNCGSLTTNSQWPKSSLFGAAYILRMRHCVRLPAVLEVLLMLHALHSFVRSIGTTEKRSYDVWRP